MEKIQHFVLTKFNVKFKDYKKDKNKSLIKINNRWLMDRFNLFDKFCFPSVKHQTNLNFKWLVFFDESTSLKYRGVIDKYKNSFSNFVPIFTNEVNLMADLLNAIDNKTNYLITTRLDNDDALHKTSIEVIQKNFGKQKFQFLNFLKGYRLNIKTDNKFPFKFLIFGFLSFFKNYRSHVIKDNKFSFKFLILDFLSLFKNFKLNNKLFFYEHSSNPFITLIEKKHGGTFKTVWCGISHNELNKLGPIKQISDKRYWLQVIHGKNLINEETGLRLCSLNRLKNSFYTNLD